MGYSDIQKEGRYVSMSNAEELDYQNWYKTEPNNADGIEHCAAIHVKYVGWVDLILYARNKFNILKDFFQLLYFLCYFDMSTINPTVIFLLIEQTIKSLQSFIFSSFIYLNTKCIFFSKIRFLRSCRCRVSKFSSNLETFCLRFFSTMV